jgi:hypothetical protein
MTCPCAIYFTLEAAILEARARSEASPPTDYVVLKSADHGDAALESWCVFSFPEWTMTALAQPRAVCSRGAVRCVPG